MPTDDTPKTWEEEAAAITTVAHLHGVDPAFIAAIRRAENGKAGRQFGVMLPEATTYAKQLAGCVKTIRGYLIRYTRNPFALVQTDGDFRRLIYTLGFLQFAQSIYCEIGADNDPTQKNQYWLENVRQHYERFCVRGLV